MTALDEIITEFYGIDLARRKVDNVAVMSKTSALVRSWLRCRTAEAVRQIGQENRFALDCATYHSFLLEPQKPSANLALPVPSPDNAEATPDVIRQESSISQHLTWHSQPTALSPRSRLRP